MSLRLRLLLATDRLLAVVLATLLVGTTLAFGGAAWWGRPFIAVLTATFVLLGMGRILLEGKLRVLKSPLAFFGLLVVVLAAAQLAPLPAKAARLLSPHSRELYTQGVLPGHALADDPELELPEPVGSRSPVTLDRSATLRWLAGAVVCLALFWGVSQFADRLGRLYLVWGCIVTAFAVNTVFAFVQVVCRANGLFGFIEPGKGPAWAPSIEDLLNAPGSAALRGLADDTGAALPAWSTLVPDRPFSLGSLLGGPAAYVALASIGLPLTLALALQIMAPRGSRESLSARFGESGQGSLVLLLACLLVAGGLLVGFIAGPLLSLPFGVALLFVGIPGAWPTGLRWSGVGMTFLVLSAVALGIGGGEWAAQNPGVLASVRLPGPAVSLSVWSDTWKIIRDFPVLGTGLGSFASVYPYYKSHDAAQTTALSTMAQWVAETGLLGLALLVAAGLWSLSRLPEAVRRVGSADRALVFGLIGAAVGFSLYATVHWTVELAAVALLVSALGGTWNRWLAGGTDLFVERA
ncbi:MAG: O-antigen ligase family protein [Isosphaeraceae bacterium]|nr:O-antigen ligase family protein [Isosphaeraceae bacterium]